jgi:regulator of sirC expression with transglutaminase-like and TPR domain
MTPDRQDETSRPLTFEALARLPDEAIDVTLGAAMIARDVYVRLDLDAILGQFDDLAKPLAALSLARRPLREQAETITARFVELGFRGNVDDYYDPKNSLLPDVLERRLGIPITLSVVWCELARRAGVSARGVAFPGHFLVRLDGGTGEPVIVDPFGGGRLVDDAAATDLLRRTLGEGAELHPALLAEATPRALLVRLLANLKAIWAGRGEHGAALLAIDRMLTLVPDSARLLRERAGVALRLGAVDLAQGDLARVLELEPEAPDVPQIRERLAHLARAASSASARTWN